MHKWQNSIMNKNINKRVAELRLHLRKNGLAAYIFPSTDPHHSEYPPEHWKTREWISGFNGSAGTAVVTSDDAALWTDSRYFIAAEEQLKDTPFPCFPMFGRVFAMVRVCAGENIGGQSVFP